MLRPPIINDLTSILRDLTNEIQLHREHANPVASGGFSDIYKAKLGDIDVAVKRLRHVFSADPQAAKRKLMREMEVWSQLEHKNLLPFYGYCVAFPKSETQHLDDTHPQWCFVSPWMKHGEARSFLQLHPEIDRLQTVVRVASGLNYLHILGIVHGDIKGANILINHLGNPFLSDFGLSKWIDSNTIAADGTATNTLRGSPRWMAYELLEPSISPFDDDETFGTPTYQTDIWSFACTAIELTTVTRPFDAIPSDIAVISAIMKKQLPYIPPRTSPAHPSQPVIVPIMRSVAPQNFQEVDKWEGLWDLCMECWELDPNDRPSMDEILDRLTTIHSRGPRDTDNLIAGSPAASGARKRSRSPESHSSAESHVPIDSSPSPSPEPEVIPKGSRIHTQDDRRHHEPSSRARKRHSSIREDNERHSLSIGVGSGGSTSGSGTPTSRKSRPSRLSNSFQYSSDDDRPTSSRPSPHSHPYARHRATSSHSSPHSSTPVDRSPNTQTRSLHPNTVRHRKQTSSGSSIGLSQPTATSAPASLSSSRSASFLGNSGGHETQIAFPTTGLTYSSPSPASSSSGDNSIEAHTMSTSEVLCNHNTHADFPYHPAVMMQRHPTFPPSSGYVNQSFLQLDYMASDAEHASFYHETGYLSTNDLVRQPSLSASDSDSVTTPLQMHPPLQDVAEFLMRDVPYPYQQHEASGEEIAQAEYERLADEYLLLSKQPSPTSPTHKATRDSPRPNERKISESIDIRSDHFDRYPGIEEFIQMKREESQSPNHSPILDGVLSERQQRGVSPSEPVDHWTNSPAALNLKQPLPADTPSLAPRLTLVYEPTLQQPTSAPCPSSSDYHEDPSDWDNAPPQLPPDSYKSTVLDSFDDETDVEYDHENAQDMDDFQLSTVIPLGSDDEDGYFGAGTPLSGGGGLMGGWTGDEEEEEKEGPATPRARPRRMPASPQGLGLSM